MYMYGHPNTVVVVVVVVVIRNSHVVVGLKQHQERIMRHRESLRTLAGICKFHFMETRSRFPEKSSNLNFDLLDGKII